jgi:hypothetical protein
MMIGTISRIILLIALASISLLTAAGQTPENRCPKIVATGPSSTINPGDEMLFYVTVGNRFTADYRYDWIINNGTIVSGQNTSMIHVGTNAGMSGSSVIASVRVSGIPTGCEGEAAEISSIAQAREWEALDRFDFRSDNDTRVHLDNLFITLQNDPQSEGLIIFELDKEEAAGKKQRPLNVLAEHIKFRKFDAHRITVAVSEISVERDRVTFTTIPPGAQMPVKKDEYKIIPAEYLKDEIPQLFKKQI